MTDHRLRSYDDESAPTVPCKDNPFADCFDSDRKGDRHTCATCPFWPEPAGGRNDHASLQKMSDAQLQATESRIALHLDAVLSTYQLTVKKVTLSPEPRRRDWSRFVDRRGATVDLVRLGLSKPVRPRADTSTNDTGVLTVEVRLQQAIDGGLSFPMLSATTGSLLITPHWWATSSVRNVASILLEGPDDVRTGAWQPIPLVNWLSPQEKSDTGWPLVDVMVDTLGERLSRKSGEALERFYAERESLTSVLLGMVPSDYLVEVDYSYTLQEVEQMLLPMLPGTSSPAPEAQPIGDTVVNHFGKEEGMTRRTMSRKRAAFEGTEVDAGRFAADLLETSFAEVGLVVSDVGIGSTLSSFDPSPPRRIPGKVSLSLALSEEILAEVLDTTDEATAAAAGDPEAAVALAALLEEQMSTRMAAFTAAGRRNHQEGRRASDLLANTVLGETDVVMHWHYSPALATRLAYAHCTAEGRAERLAARRVVQMLTSEWMS